MKKIIISFILSFFIIINTFASCKIPDKEFELWWESVSELLDQCRPGDLVWTSWKYTVEDEFKKQISKWVQNISSILWILAIWALVYAALLMTISAWEDEKIKKAKDIIKWTIIWFVWLISAWSIIYIVINAIYWLSA